MIARESIDLKHLIVRLDGLLIDPLLGLSFYFCLLPRLYSIIFRTLRLASQVGVIYNPDYLFSQMECI
jgi:hypothetical protein